MSALPWGRRRFFVFAAALFAVILVTATSLGLYFRTPASGYDSLVNASPETIFRVEKGMSPAAVAENLQRQGLVRSQRVFRLLSRVTGAARKLQAGSYRIRKGDSMGSILSMMVEGRQATERITIPEGLTVRMTASLLESRGVVRSDDFLAVASSPEFLSELGIPASSMEGYLFPDTYFFPVGIDAKEAIRIMAGAFRKAVDSLPALGRMDPASLHRSVILASVIEREYRVAEEAPKIASVFLNRLGIGMPLQSCATVVYVITEKLGRPHPSVVRYADLAIADAYNTYLHRGLPPGPISSPGITALSALASPGKTDYLYFRLEDAEKGSHRFSRTLEEHGNAELSVKGR